MNTILNPNFLTFEDGQTILANHKGTTPSGLSCVWSRCNQRTPGKDCGILRVDGEIIARRITLREAERRVRGM